MIESINDMTSHPGDVMSSNLNDRHPGLDGTAIKSMLACLFFLRVTG